MNKTDDGVPIRDTSVTYEYFLEEYHRFRAIMGSTAYDWETKEAAFSGLSYVYFNVDCGDDIDKEETLHQIFVALSDEFTRRQAMSLVVH